MSTPVEIERVHNAAAFLDIEIPGWHNMIDLDDFDMSSCTRCVLGQIFGRNMEAKLNTILSPEMMGKVKEYARGLTGYDTGSRYLNFRGRHKLDTEGAFASDNCHWIEEILERRSKEIGGA